MKAFSNQHNNHASKVRISFKSQIHHSLTSQGEYIKIISVFTAFTITGSLVISPGKHWRYRSNCLNNNAILFDLLFILYQETERVYITNLQFLLELVLDGWALCTPSILFVSPFDFRGIISLSSTSCKGKNFYFFILVLWLKPFATCSQIASLLISLVAYTGFQGFKAKIWE